VSPLKSALCIYCRVNVANELDHVPPKCLFPRPRPADLVTVPSCADCNRRFGRDDEYFRDVLALYTFDSDGLPELKRLQDAMLRSLRRERVRPPARRMLERSRTDWVPYRSTLAERVRLVPVKMNRIGRTVERVVQGLHFHETGRVLPPSHAPRVIDSGSMRKVSRLDLPFFQDLFAPLSRAEWKSIGHRAFGYAVTPARDAPDSTVWAVSFFGALIFVAFICAD
jgi:hypothetical protein